MGHFAPAQCIQWRGSKATCWNDACESIQRNAEVDDGKKTPCRSQEHSFSLLVQCCMASLLCFLFLPSELIDVKGGTELPQKISEVAGDYLQLRGPSPALRGCCGEPTEFQWLFLGSSDQAIAGEPFRTVLVARDSRGRQARPAACGALRVDVDLTGKAHLSGGPFRPWRLAQLELDIENELAEVVQAEVRIESPDPEADILLHRSRIRFMSGPTHSFSLRVDPPGGGSQRGRGGGAWQLQEELTVVLSSKDQFGNPAGFNVSGQGRLYLRSSVGQQHVKMMPATGLFSGNATGQAQVRLIGLRPGVVDIWVEQAGGEYQSKQQQSLLRAATKQSLTFSQAQTGPSHSSPSAYLAAFRATAGPDDAKWQRKADQVREAFQHAWRSYEKYAWGQDELQPLSAAGRNSFGGTGLTILDSLSTLWLMGLDEEFQKGVKFVSEDLDFDRADSDVSVFELTIRALGGLLGAHTLSGKELLLERAKELGDRLLPAFKTNSRIPLPTVNLARGISKASTQPIILSEAGSVQVEFRSLAARTGDSRFKGAADQAFQAIQSTGMHGILPVFLSPPSMMPVQAVASKFAFGALADSYYEYLLKQWLQSPSEMRFKEIFLEVMDALPSIVRPLPASVKSAEAGTTRFKLIEIAADGNVVWKMDHLSCFAPALIALGLMELPAQDVASRNATWWHLAEGLTASCVELWTSSPSGLAPEFSKVSAKPPHDFIEAASDGRHSFLRPETAESLFYLYRLTGDEKYRRWGEKMFNAILDNAKVPNGFASVRDVKAIPTSKMDEMQTFVMSETFKYLFLLFSPAAAFDMDKYFFNTEGHPLKRHEL
ncbi:MNS1 [Symbiodinium necroappetens]|uniref:alpha-1,2-Mannosidase n=1 Tax=Symbiodinium necroappetens TaxID=1628268 RepID=A0A812RIV2_9DINO|nr:MNS1 [Symbiodinium necroappetens]|mmetsp:Transcript_38721/g.92487  ORF Transcript_38721/g.92487 Transcript_38721/m.92487 type:complete len:829 (-) Transcript_38721:12-2498(-)